MSWIVMLLSFLLLKTRGSTSEKCNSYCWYFLSTKSSYKGKILKLGIVYFIHLLIVDALSSSTKSSFSFLSFFFQNFILLTHLLIPSFLFFSLAKRLWWSFLNGLVGMFSALVGSEEYDSVSNMEDALSAMESSWSLKFFYYHNIVFFYNISSRWKSYFTFYISNIGDVQT